MTLLSTLGAASMSLVIVHTFATAASAAPEKGQTRVDSLREAWVNIFIGFTINYVANLLLLPLIGIRPSLAENFWLGCIYTSISIIRQYAIRRVFNRRMVRQERKL